jgi:hypothetical protein
VDFQRAEAEATHLREDLVGRLGPREGLALVVVDRDVVEDAWRSGMLVWEPRLRASSDSRPKKRSTRFNQDE